MNGKFWIAFIVAAIVGFFGGWALWGIALEGYYAANTSDAATALHRADEDMIFWAMIVGQLGWAFFTVWLLDRTGSRTAASGAVTAAVAFALIAVGYNFFMHAMMDMFTSTSIVFVDVIVNAIFGGIIGAIVGWILGYGSTE